MLLLVGATEGLKIELTSCPHCSAALLIDKLGVARRACVRCTRRRRAARKRDRSQREGVTATERVRGSDDHRVGFEGKMEGVPAESILVREQRDESIVQEQRHAEAQR